jgi:hypothetical protein
MEKAEKSTEVEAMTDAGERRTCTGCGKIYLLPLDYTKANPVIRDLCYQCIAAEQQRRAEDEGS